MSQYSRVDITSEIQMSQFLMGNAEHAVVNPRPKNTPDWN